MRGDEARELLGFPPGSRPSPSQVKAAYKRKAWESHPDRFPEREKSEAESKFKMILEAYSCLQTATHVRVVRKGAYGAHRSNSTLVKAPFLFIILATLSLGGYSVSRAYKRAKEECPHNNPFLP
ncbi:hypothetical protein Taro_031294 [Colocasia esculenta]|uniref:J domain-containing protein n=1 Tax=Colocasia esculenta TaxID=4460 RepID=A0A843W0G4_COLES|nr:hypothetical protein [Colocasia esculenta]